MARPDPALFLHPGKAMAEHRRAAPTKPLVDRDGEDAPPVPVTVPPSQRRGFNVVVLLVLSAGAALVIGRMLWPFLTAIGSALVLAVLAHRPYRALSRRIPNESVAALLGTALLFFAVFLPVLAISFHLIRTLPENVDIVADSVRDLLEPGGSARRWVYRVAGWMGAEEETLTDALADQLRALGDFFAGRTLGLLSGIGGGVVQAAVALFTLFYLLRDGEGLLAETGRIIPLDEDLSGSLVERSAEIIHATMFGNVVVAITQGTLGGVTFWLLGIPGAILWGSVMVLLGFLPVLGPPVVWVPAAVILALQGEVWRALVLVAVGTLIVGTVDNVVRSLVVGGRAALHPLVVFFSALGGILLFGVVGLFLGPVLFVLSITLLEATRLVLAPDDNGRAR